MPDSTLLERERARFSARQLERMRDYRAQQVRSAAAQSASPEDVPAQVEELYSHLPDDEKEEIARRAVAGPPVPDTQTHPPPADGEVKLIELATTTEKLADDAETVIPGEREDDVPKKKQTRRPGLTADEKRRAAEILRKRLEIDPGVSCAGAWRECAAGDISMAYSTFYSKFWRPEQRARAQQKKPPATNGAAPKQQPARHSVAIESPEGRFSVEVAADGRRRITMDMVVGEALGGQIARLVIDSSI